jgi:hypothetical protein
MAHPDSTAANAGPTPIHFGIVFAAFLAVEHQNQL